MRLTVKILALLFAFQNTTACESGSAAPGIDAGVLVDAQVEDAKMPEMDAAATVEDDAEVPEPACDDVPPAPIAYETIPGFTQTEDFQFDAEGRYVGVDQDGNIVRITRDGERRLFIPNAGSLTGMRFLPDGDLVYARLEDGTLYRAAPNGAVVPVLSGLVYPNGLEVDLDGMIYVSEFSAGRVRRVDPQTGDFTVVARGLHNPNGLSFDPDYSTLYVGSFGTGVVYGVAFDAAGTPGTPTIVGQTPESTGAEPPRGPDAESLAACEGIAEGEPCTLGEDELSEAGRCYTLGASRYCGIEHEDPWIGACTDLAEGDPCTLAEGIDPGTCTAYVGVLYCILPDPYVTACEGLVEGAACAVEDGLGECDDYQGTIYCNVPLPYVVACDDHLDGDACTIRWGEGETLDGFCYTQQGTSYCWPEVEDDPFALTCAEQEVDAPCSPSFVGETYQGHCRDYGVGYLYCEAEADQVTPCLELSADDACVVDYFGTAVVGQCENDHGGLLCSISEAVPERGGLDGLGVDECGSIYVTEFDQGIVWRMSPDGSRVEMLADLPVQWVPNIHWGPGVGGFDADKLYVVSRDDGSLHEMPVGVMEKHRGYP